MEQKHIDRLTSGEYSATVGAQYLEFASDSERIADHLLNVARTIKDLQIEQ
jgi:Na+/phosphate symporter